jgi:hypothetical protein
LADADDRFFNRGRAMDTEAKAHDRPTQRTARLATTSLVLGVLALLPFTYAWFFVWMTWAEPMSTWYFGWMLVIGFHVPVFVGIFLGMSSLITGRTAGKSAPQSRRAKFGTILGMTATALAILYLGQFCLLGEGFGFVNWALVEPYREFAPHVFLPKFEEVGGIGVPGLPFEHTFVVSNSFSEEDAMRVGDYYQREYGEGSWVIGFYCLEGYDRKLFRPEYMLFEYRSSDGDSLPTISTPLRPSRPNQGTACK